MITVFSCRVQSLISDKHSGYSDESNVQWNMNSWFHGDSFTEFQNECSFLNFSPNDMWLTQTYFFTYRLLVFEKTTVCNYNTKHSRTFLKHNSEMDST